MSACVYNSCRLQSHGEAYVSLYFPRSFLVKRAIILRFIKNKNKTKTTTWNRTTASVLKQDPNTKRFNRTRIYFNTDSRYVNFRGSPLYQATKRHLNNRSTIKNDEKWKKKAYLDESRYVFFLQCTQRIQRRTKKDSEVPPVSRKRVQVRIIH